MRDLLALTVPGSGGDIKISLPPQINTIVNGITSNSVISGSNIFGWALNIAFTGAAVAALCFIIYGGYKWIISNGDAKNLETAHNILIYAAFGLAIVLLSAFIVNTAAFFFCVPFLGWVPPQCH